MSQPRLSDLEFDSVPPVSLCYKPQSLFPKL